MNDGKPPAPVFIRDISVLIALRTQATATVVDLAVVTAVECSQVYNTRDVATEAGFASCRLHRHIFSKTR